jgi:hypothetical protein
VTDFVKTVINSRFVSGECTDSQPFEIVLLQELALNACTTLVSVDPKLTMATRDRILQVRGFVEYSNYIVFPCSLLKDKQLICR